MSLKDPNTSRRTASKRTTPRRHRGKHSPQGPTAVNPPHAEGLRDAAPAIRASMVSFRLTKDGRLRVVFFAPQHPAA